jgi:IS30 family transposase
MQKAEKLWKLLPRKRARRGRRKRRTARNTIAGRRSIHDRPEDVESRETVGHWEGDLMICNRTRPVLVLKERKSRFVIAAKLSGKTAAETAGAIMDVFQRLALDIRKSITFDNGGEFAGHGWSAMPMPRGRKARSKTWTVGCTVICRENVTSIKWAMKNYRTSCWATT